MAKDKTIYILTAFIIIQIIMDVMLAWNLSAQTQATQSNHEVLEDFVDYAQMLDKKIDLTRNAHNLEVESWYLGNRHISKTKREFSNALVQDTNQTLARFRDCTGRFDVEGTFSLNVPHVRPDGNVDGYIMFLYDRDFDEIGYWELTKEYSDYWVYDCGRAYYNVSAGELSFEESGDFA
jgi:hypothetical protein